MLPNTHGGNIPIRHPPKQNTIGPTYNNINKHTYTQQRKKETRQEIYASQTYQHIMQQSDQRHIPTDPTVGTTKRANLHELKIQNATNSIAEHFLKPWGNFIDHNPDWLTQNKSTSFTVDYANVNGFSDSENIADFDLHLQHKFLNQTDMVLVAETNLNLRNSNVTQQLRKIT
jgi:hypothetical protein